MFSTKALLLAALLSLSLAAPVEYSRWSVEPRATGTKYMFVFGDSYSMTGYSWTSSSQPSAINPLGNPTIGKGTSSGGYNWVDYLATTYNNSLLYTFDSAVGGSTVDQDIVNSLPYSSTASDFPTELAGWKDYQGARAPSWEGDNALFAVWFGVNDVHVGFSKGDLNDLYNRDISSLFNGIKTLYTAGARNFAILNLPPISRAPKILNADAADRQGVWDAQGIWASTLESHFDDFAADHPSANAKLVDVKSAFDRVLDDPGSYDLPNNWCLDADGMSCPWASAMHPGVKIHKQVARTVAGEFPAFFT